MAEAQAVDTQKVNRLIEEILGSDRDGRGGQLHTLGERVSSGNLLLKDLTTRVKATITMINQLRAAHNELQQGQSQVQADLDAQMTQSAADLETLRAELKKAEQEQQNAQAELTAARQAQMVAEANKEGEAAKAAKEAAEAAARQAQQNVDNAEANARRATQVLEEAERRHAEDRAMLEREYIKATKALELINQLLEQRNNELNTVLQDLQRLVKMIPPSQAPAQSPQAAAQSPQAATDQKSCTPWGKEDRNVCRMEDRPCLYKRPYNFFTNRSPKEKCYPMTTGKNLPPSGSGEDPPPPSAGGGKRRKSRRVKKSHKRKHHKTRKGKGGWQVSKPKSKKSRKSHRKQRRHGTRKHK